MNLKMIEAGDLESTRFYYLFIKNSVTDNSVRCSLPTWPEEKDTRGGRGPSQLGPWGYGDERRGKQG